MRALTGLIALLVVACAPVEGVQNDTRNQPHLPPPGFPPVTQVEGQVCGGMMRNDQPECDAGEYCHRDISAQCGAADAPGVCRVRPEMCTQDYNPVCACDGQTYPNECAANGQGVSAAYLGECK